SEALPVVALSSGRMCLNRPESSVDVVDATTMDFSCAAAGEINATARARAFRQRRISISFLPVWSSQQQFAGEEARGFLAAGSRKECLGGRGLDHPPAMQHKKVAGGAPRL